jgi:hypothetical protein
MPTEAKYGLRKPSIAPFLVDPPVKVYDEDDVKDFRETEEYLDYAIALEDEMDRVVKEKKYCYLADIKHLIKKEWPVLDMAFDKVTLDPFSARLRWVSVTPAVEHYTFHVGRPTPKTQPDLGL